MGDKLPQTLNKREGILRTYDHALDFCESSHRTIILERIIYQGLVERVRRLQLQLYLT